MKNIYATLLKNGLLLFLLLLIFNNSVSAQCPDGSPQGGVAFDTTIRFASGIINKDVKFAKFNPQNGMLTCVKLCVTIKGVIDSVAIENYTNDPQTASYTYKRQDTIRGPGIPTFLTSAPANLTFGPYPLDPFDGVYDSGPDLYTNGPDTVLYRQLCTTISDSASIASFYGSDSVSYTYSINASATGTIPGGSGQAMVRSSALVNFRFEYCTCPAEVLPLNVRDFKTIKIGNTKAQLEWSGFDDAFANYHYEAEMSRNGTSFITIGRFEKNTKTSDAYKMLFTVPNGESGSYYFRIKQVYSNGYVRYSNISYMSMESSVNAKFSLYPNPSNGVVGIKFDTNSTGRFDVQIFNAQGQIVLNKSIVANGSSYMQVAKLNSGSYWLRLTDRETQSSCINQLLIK